MAADRDASCLAEWRQMLGELAAAVAASGKAHVTLEIDVTKSDGTRLRAKGEATALPDGCAQAHGGGLRRAQQQRRPARSSARPDCRRAPVASSRGPAPRVAASVEQQQCVASMPSPLQRRCKSILRLARKVWLRKLVAVARLAPALASWVRRVHNHQFAPSPAMWWRCHRQREVWLQRKAAMITRRKRDAEEAAALEGRQQLLGSNVSPNIAEEAVGSSPKRQSRPSSRADGGGP